MVRYYIFFTVLFLATVISVLVAFSVVGNPMEQKDIQLYTAKITAITSIQSSIDSYAYDAKRLPNSLEELKTRNQYVEINDPETKAPFTYQKISNTEFKLCTNFKADSTKVAQSSPYIIRVGSTDKLTYKKGFDCISKTVVLPAPTPIPISEPPMPLTTDTYKPTETPAVGNGATAGNPSQYLSESGTVDSISTDAYGQKLTAFSLYSSQGKGLTVLVDSETTVVNINQTSVTVNNIKVGTKISLKYYKPTPTSPNYAREIRITSN